jgi:hypothetical protein
VRWFLLAVARCAVFVGVCLVDGIFFFFFFESLNHLFAGSLACSLSLSADIHTHPP